MRLVACQSCHTQYDVSDVSVESFPCRCGETVANARLEAVDAKIHRCGSCGAAVEADGRSCGYCGSEIEHDPRKLSLICPECYARNADAARFCTACGVGFSPEAVRVEGHELPCPVCGVLMPPRQVGDVGLNECPRCNGLWVPGDRFERLVARAIEAHRDASPEALLERAPRARGANPAAQGVAYRKCPECQAFMQRRNFRRSSGVILDRCRDHGCWLDADELEQIAGFILAGGQTSELLEAPSAAEQRATVLMAKARARREARASRSAWGRGDAADVVDAAGSLLSLLHRLIK